MRAKGTTEAVARLVVRGQDQALAAGAPILSQNLRSSGPGFKARRFKVCPRRPPLLNDSLDVAGAIPFGMRFAHSLLMSPTNPDQTPANVAFREAAASRPKLLDQVRHAIRMRHYSRRTDFRPVTTFEPSRRCWVIRTSARR